MNWSWPKTGTGLLRVIRTMEILSIERMRENNDCLLKKSEDLEGYDGCL